MDVLKIYDRLQSDFELLEREGYEVVGVFLQGSQNYCLDYEGSDIDTKAIVLPSFEDFVLSKKMVSNTIVLESSEHIDVKDIRLMFNNFKKQNINFVEILFTDYFYINPKYRDSFDKIFKIRERIARYDIHRTLNSIAGMSMEKYKAMEHPYPSIAHKIEQFGYDGKQLSHIERLYDFVQKYIDGRAYRKCLKVNKGIRKHLIDVKTNQKYDLDTARTVAKEFCDKTYDFVKSYKSANENIIDVGVDEIMTSVLIEVFKIRFNQDGDDYVS